MAIIKCPECGHDVSDKAPRCPSCGVEILGNLTICPQCGTKYLLSQKICPKCNHQNTPNSLQIPQQTTPGSGKNNKLYITIIIGVFVLIAIAITGIYIYKSQNNINREKDEYEFALSSNDVAVLQKYIDTYDESNAPVEHIQMIKSRMSELQEANMAWTNAVVSNSKSALEQYLKDYPNSQYKNIAIHKIDSIDWTTARESNTIEAYETYLHNQPNGEYFDEASDCIRNIRTQTVQPEEEIMIDMIFRNFFQSINSKDETALSNSVNPVLTSFLGKQDATRMDVISFMNKIYKNNVSRMDWHTNGDYKISKKEIGEQQYEYTVEFNATQDVEYSDATTHRQNFKIISKVSPDGKIQEFNMKKIIEQ